MKLRAFAIMAATVLALAPANAEDARPDPKGPLKTMGDEGKLPATNTMGGAVSQMNEDNK